MSASPSLRSSTLTEVNDAPTAVLDTPTVAEDGSVVVNAAGNDVAGPSNESGQTLTVTAVGTPTHGSAVIISSGPNEIGRASRRDGGYNGEDDCTGKEK